MRYRVQSTVLTRRGGADTYQLALLEPVDAGRQPLLLRRWQTKGYAPKSIFQRGFSVEKAAELRESHVRILADQTAKGYRSIEVCSNPHGAELADILVHPASFWWFAMEPDQVEKLIAYLRTHELADPGERHEAVLATLEALAAGRTMPVPTAASFAPPAQPAPAPEPPRPAPELAMAGFGAWA